MAIQNTYVGVVPRNIIADPNGPNIAIGMRVVIAAGVAALAGSNVRGDFVTLGPIEAGQPGEAVSMQSAGNMIFNCGVASIAVDDLIYGAASGQVTNVSNANVYIGKAQSAAVSGGPVQVEMSNPA